MPEHPSDHATHSRTTRSGFNAPTAGAAAALVPLLFLATIMFSGCRAGPKDFDNENDALRRQVGQLESEVARLAAERNEAIAQRELALARLKATEGEPAAAVVRSMPASAGIRIGRLSGAIADADPDWVDAVEVYVRPHDGRQRFVQVAGTMTVEAVRLGPAGATDPAMPAMIGSVELDPDGLREAYRSSPMGTHYVVRVPLSTPIAREKLGRVAITVLLEDAVTRQRHVATEVTDRVYTRSPLDG